MDRCFEEFDKLILEQSVEQQKYAVSPLLYHYTDGPGLLGILDSGTIRLTDIYGLNDPSEIRHGVEMACNVIDEVTKGQHPAAELFAQQFSDLIQGNVEKLGRVFIACFSRDGDDLGQWRAYAANGSGYAVGFDGPMLEKAFAARGTDQNTTIHIYYDDRVLRGLMERLVRLVLPLLALPAGQNVSEEVVREFLTTVATNLSIAVLHTAMLFKHKAYDQEQEYRFLHLRDLGAPIEDLKRRARGASIIHFNEFDWKKADAHILREIVIGPAAREDVARTFVAECLSIGGIAIDTVKVTRSSIPYRG
jgi:hypothetical protein